MNQTEAFYEANKAHVNREIKTLLIPWLSFKLYIKFTGPEKGKKRTFYGNEHQVTYNQCLHQKVRNIPLRKYKGYYDLVNLVESLKGKYISAKIYMRDPESKEFDILCREYYKGGIQLQNDPILSEDEGMNLYYYIKNNRVVITETDPAMEDFKIPD